jgi:hypothetical protein
MVVHMIPKEQLTTISKYDDMFNYTVDRGSAAAPGDVTATHQRRSAYMYVPRHGSTRYTQKERAQSTNGDH